MVAGPLFSPLLSSDSRLMPHHTSTITKSSRVFPNSGSSEKSWNGPTVLHAAGTFSLKRVAMVLRKEIQKSPSVWSFMIPWSSTILSLDKPHNENALLQHCSPLHPAIMALAASRQTGWGA